MKKQEIISMFKSYQEQVNNNTDYSNHWLRRFFRCYIDGSYKGQEHYKRNIAYIKDNKDNKIKLRAFAISSMIDFLSIEYPHISSSTIQKAIVQAMAKNELEILNAELIEDCLNLIKE